MLILPGEPEFDETLATTLPPDWQFLAGANGDDYGFVVDADSGLIRVENSAGIREYLRGGEYDERLAQIDDDDDDDDFYWIE